MSARLFTPEQEAEIVRRYLANESAEKIALSILPGSTISGNVIRNVLRRREVPLREAAHMSNPIITDAQKERAVVMCRDEGFTLQEAADALGISKKTVSNAVRAVGLCRPGGKPRTCEVDDTAFDVLTPESLYWIGFLFADGNVHQDVIKQPRKSRATAGSPALNVGLSAVDRRHLEKLRTFLGSTHAISERVPHDSAPTFKGGPIVNTGASVYLSIRSKGLCTALASYGIVSKGARVPVPEVAESRDFWRGMVDGDGSLGLGGGEYPSIRLAGQHALVLMFADFLRQEKLANLQPYVNKPIWMIGTTGRSALQIVRYLYRDASISLDRKQHTAEWLISKFHDSDDS